MTDEDQRRALEAERLLKDKTLNDALKAMREEALEGLMTADPEKFSEVAKAQCRVAVIEDFGRELRRFCLKGHEQKKRSVA